MKPVYLAYNWIGPDGPLPNLELPTLYDMMHRMHEVQGTPEYNIKHIRDNFADESRMGINEDLPVHFKVAPLAAMTEDDPYVVNFILGHNYPHEWHFTPGFDWGNNKGLFEKSAFPYHAVEHCRSGQGYILIDQSLEAWVAEKHFKPMHDYFYYHQIPLSHVIYKTGTGNAEQEYRKFFKAQGWDYDNDERMHIIEHFPSAQALACTERDAEEHKPYDVNHMPQRLFLCFNKRHRPHRLMLSVILEKHKLIAKSFISMLETDVESERHVAMTPEFNEKLSMYGCTKEHAHDLQTKLPLTIDTVDHRDVKNIIYDNGDELQGFYDDSLISLCTETTFMEDEPMALTEKCMKPIKYKHPFIIVGAQGILHKLRTFGYKTFDNWWDESYDDEPNPYKRIQMIGQVCDDIALWDHVKVMDFKQEVAEIIEHNYRHFINNPWSSSYEQIYQLVLGEQST